MLAQNDVTTCAVTVATHEATAALVAGSVSVERLAALAPRAHDCTVGARGVRRPCIPGRGRGAPARLEKHGAPPLAAQSASGPPTSPSTRFVVGVLAPAAG